MARRIPQPLKPTQNSTAIASSRTHIHSATKSEEFYDYLTSLGYVHSRQKKSEHFDYLFNDAETSKFMDTLRVSIKPRNCVSDTDILRIKKLEEEGHILHGDKLEEQVSNAKKMEAEFDEERKMESFQEAELRRKIEEKIASIKELERLNAMIDDTIKQGKKEDSMKAYLQASHPLESANLETKLASQQEVVNSIIDSLSIKLHSVFLKYQTSVDENEKITHQDTEVASLMNWNEIIEEEDELIELCQKIAQKCGRQLMNEGGDVDEPVLVEEIRQSFEQYSKDIERLKHAIIFESVKKLRLKAIATAYANTSAPSRIGGILDELKSVNALEPKCQKILAAERTEVQKGLKEKLKEMRIRRPYEFRKALALRFSHDIKRLSELKAGGMSQVTELLSFLLEIVRHQISRVFILRQMAQPEDRKMEEFATEAEGIFADLKILTETQDSFDPNILRIQDFSAKDKQLADYLSKFEIPVSVMISYQSTWESLAWIRDEQIEKIKTSIVHATAQEIKERIIDISGKENLIFNLWRTVKTEQLDKIIQNAAKILQVEKVQDEMRNKLNSYSENKSVITKSAIEKKMGIVQEMQAQILLIKNEKKKRERMDSSF